MTTWPLPRIAAAEPLSTGAKLGRRLSAWADGLRAWAGLLRDLKSVHELDDRMLADMGFTRGDLDRVVRHGSGTDEIRGRAAPIRPTPPCPAAGRTRALGGRTPSRFAPGSRATPCGSQPTARPSPS